MLLAFWAFVLIRHDEYTDPDNRLVIGNSAVGLLLTAACISVGPELAGIVIGVMIIDYLNERRQERERKGILVGLLGSEHRDVTETAIIELKRRGWLVDGSLAGAFLGRANLKGADLVGANLSRAMLVQANLTGTLLYGANLSGAVLWQANLSLAHLNVANLNGAEFVDVNLSGAELWDADLTGARGLTFEQLERAGAPGAFFRALEGATMPDGVRLGGGPQGIEGPTYEQWKAAFLTRQAPTVQGIWENDPGEEE